MQDDRRRVPHGLVAIVPAMLLGVLISAQTQSLGRHTIAAARYNVPLVEAAAELQQEQARLKDQIVQLRAQLDALAERGATQSGQSSVLHAEVERLRPDVGLDTLSGAGVTVTLDDGRLAAGTDRRSLEQAIVHSTDITDVFNAAWKAGAEGIAVNGERITGASACVGAVIQINGTLLSPPFVIAIVGPPDRLLAALNDRSELRDQKQRHDAFGLGLQISRASDLRLPPYSGAIQVRYAAITGR